MNRIRNKVFLPPHLILAVWLAFIGVTVLQHAMRSGQLPIYDAFSYFQKAHHVWARLKLSLFFNPLNVDPVSRPPGTLLMSYPFGFSPNFHWFYFRSIFLPIICFIAALYIIGWRSGMSVARHWSLAMIAMLLSTFPFFYHFEWADGFPSPGYWGMVDNFLAGTAALSAAISLRSIDRRSISLLIGSVFLCVLCILIKPEGAVLMALIGLAWFACVLLEFKSAYADEVKRVRLLKYAMQGIVVQGLIFGVSVYICLHSKYLSAGSFALGEASMHVLRVDFSSSLNFTEVCAIIHRCFGYQLVLWAILAVPVALVYRKKFSSSKESGTSVLVRAALTTALYIIPGLWFWLVPTSISQVRFFFPFALMAIVTSTPAVLGVLEVLPPPIRYATGAATLLFVVNLGLLLGQANPSMKWQLWTGVNLTAKPHSEVAQAKSFLRSLKQGEKCVHVYAIDMLCGSATFQNACYYENDLNPALPKVIFLRPIDWRRPSEYRLSEMLDCEYILFTPIPYSSQAESILARKTVDSLSQEQDLFSAWFEHLRQSEGVSVISGPTPCLLKVNSRVRVKASLDSLVRTHSWRPFFTEVNGRN